MREPKDKKLLVLLTADQHEKLKRYAEHKQVSMGDVVRRYIDRLPDVRKNEQPLTNS